MRSYTGVILVTFLLVLFMSACQSEQAPDTSDSNVSHDGSPSISGLEVVISMEGKTYEMDNVNWVDSTVTHVEDEIRFYLVQDNIPVKLNLNMKRDAVPAGDSMTFKIPDVNRPNMVVELSFYDLGKQASRMKKRIVFSEGVIEILDYGPNTLRVAFKGQGNPLMDTEMFPIEGSINIRF